MRDNPKPYEIYRHFKGNLYQILTLATYSETGGQMVVYQQLYAPYGVYVRPLEMFMSSVDKAKYPNVLQEYRFEKMEQTELLMPDPVVRNPAPTPTPQLAPEKPQSSGEDFQIDAGLLAFLEADTYERKLEILNSLHATITDEMIDTMAVSLDIEVADGDIERRYSEILNCLLTMERFECNRLRS